jgi:hypothetical protein
MENHIRNTKSQISVWRILSLLLVSLMISSLPAKTQDHSLEVATDYHPSFELNSIFETVAARIKEIIGTSGSISMDKGDILYNNTTLSQAAQNYVQIPQSKDLAIWIGGQSINGGCNQGNFPVPTYGIGIIDPFIQQEAVEASTALNELKVEVNNRLAYALERACDVEEVIINMLPWPDEQMQTGGDGYFYTVSGDAEKTTDNMRAVFNYLPLFIFIIVLLLNVQFNSFRKMTMTAATIMVGLLFGTVITLVFIPSGYSLLYKVSYKSYVFNEDLMN